VAEAVAFAGAVAVWVGDAVSATEVAVTALVRVGDGCNVGSAGAGLTMEVAPLVTGEAMLVGVGGKRRSPEMDAQSAMSSTGAIRTGTPTTAAARRDTLRPSNVIVARVPGKVGRCQTCGRSTFGCRAGWRSGAAGCCTGWRSSAMCNASCIRAPAVGWRSSGSLAMARARSAFH
jgi:hypothetical protein